MALVMALRLAEEGPTGGNEPIRALIEREAAMSKSSLPRRHC